MPTYEYVCTTCDEALEVVASIHEPSLTDCPHCEGGRLRKVFGNVGVVFKGSGFYRTDSRSKSGSKSGSNGSKSGSGSTSAGAASGSTEGGAGKSESSRATKEPAAAGSAKAASGSTSSAGSAASS